MSRFQGCIKARIYRQRNALQGPYKATKKALWSRYSARRERRESALHGTS